MLPGYSLLYKVVNKDTTNTWQLPLLMLFNCPLKKILFNVEDRQKTGRTINFRALNF